MPAAQAPATTPMLDPSALQGFFPVLMKPSHGGKLFQNYLTSLPSLVVECQRGGMRH